MFERKRQRKAGNKKEDPRVLTIIIHSSCCHCWRQDPDVMVPAAAAELRNVPELVVGIRHRTLDERDLLLGTIGNRRNYLGGRLWLLRRKEHVGGPTHVVQANGA
jgi:hypothetical protein